MAAAGLLLLASCTVDAEADRFPIGEIAVDDESLIVWMADESPERRQGLRNIKELPGDVDGLLFVFPAPSSLSFTMRGTLIPLDIWWFDAEMTLIGSTSMRPCESEPCVTYHSPGPARWALETPAGELRLDPGDRLSIVESG